ncbi:MAG: M23 family metallopeptidase [Bacteroidales bacterium]|jgi:murein DD-endopeptidase MepM/ murein hydrolase activator NlpD|nr:M23 family metallopeptidase [Bacteroidales bacterium]
MDSATFEEKVVFKLTPLSIFVAVVISILVLVILSISLVSFTFLREYIPGYGSTKQAQRIIELQAKIDTLTATMTEIEQYGEDVKIVLLGEKFAEDTLSATDMKKKEATFSVTNYDSMLMQITEQYSSPSKVSSQPHFLKSQYKETATLFFSPVGRSMQQNYTKSNHGIAINCKQGTPIYASVSGTVIYLGYEPQNGTTLIIHYPNNILMIYRQTGTPLVAAGDIVKAKQVIAITDFDQTVYFELWIDGITVDPEDYILI